MLFALPRVLAIGRRFYHISPLEDEPSTTAGSVDDASPTPATAISAEKISNHFDVHLVVGSWFYEAIVIVAMALAPYKVTVHILCVPSTNFLGRRASSLGP